MHGEHSMKKYLAFFVLLALSLTAVAAQELELFADVDAVELSAEEMGFTSGGQKADMDGNLRYYSSHCKAELRDSDWRPSKAQVEESKRRCTDLAMSVLDAAMAVVSIKVPVAGLAYTAVRSMQGCHKAIE